MDKYYDAKEAAAILHIKVQTLLTMNMHRVIPYFNPTGRKCLYKESDLEAYLTSVRVSSAAELQAKAAKY